MPSTNHLMKSMLKYSNSELLQKMPILGRKKRGQSTGLGNRGIIDYESTRGALHLHYVQYVIV